METEKFWSDLCVLAENERITKFQVLVSEPEMGKTVAQQINSLRLEIEDMTSGEKR